MADAKEAALDAIIQSYSDKVKMNPDSLLFVQLADAYRKKGAFDQALDVLRAGLARHNNLLSGLLMMGRVYAAKKDHAEAIDVLRKVVQREPSNMTAHALLSQSFMSEGRWTDAIAEYQKILSLNPEDASAQAALRDALERLRREKTAPKPAPASSAAVPGSSSSRPASQPPAPEAAPAQSVAAPREPASPASIPIAEPVSTPPEVAEPAKASSAPAPMEAPAYAAAEELAARGLYDEAVEALQRILEADPDNFMARQKLREVYAQREAMESPSAVAPAPVAPSTATAGSAASPAAETIVETQADKITDDEILYLLGLMEDASGAPAASKTAASAPSPASPPPVPAAPAEESRPAPAPKQEEPARAAAPPPAAAPEKPVSAASVPAEAATAAPAGLSDAVLVKVTEILNRFGSTSGLRQAFFIAGPTVVTSGQTLPQEQFAKIKTLVSMLSDVTKRAAVSMKQGEVKQVLVFGTEGLVMVSPAPAGTLAAVAGGSINVGLLRIALNDCLRRLAEVS